MILTLPYGTFHGHPADTFLEEVAREGFWDLGLKPYLDRIPSGSRVVDVGAHIGLYSGYLASRGCHVIAVEAHPLYLPLLQENLRPWQDQIQIVPMFAYSKMAWCQEHPEHAVPASNTWLPTTQLTASCVVAWPLDWILPRNQVDVLKIDAQGADLHVLLGAEQLIQRCHPTILLEYEARLTAQHGHQEADYRAWCRQHHYQEESINGGNAWWHWTGGNA